MSETIVGTCIVCSREIAVTKPGRLRVPADQPVFQLVHHGYRRPGDGFIVGDCFAVKLPPHEQASHAAEKYKGAAIGWRIGAELHLEALRTGKVRVLHRPLKVPVPTTARRPFDMWGGGHWRNRANDDPGWTEWAEPFTADETDLARQEVWAKLLDGNIRTTERGVEFYKEEIARMEVAIKTWEKKPLRDRLKVEPDPKRRRRRRRAF
jgi:hypothetical protein